MRDQRQDDENFCPAFQLEFGGPRLEKPFEVTRLVSNSQFAATVTSLISYMNVIADERGRH